MMKYINLINILLIAILSYSFGDTPQTESPITYFRGSKLYSGAHLETWGVREVRVTQFALPIMYSMDLKDVQPGLAFDFVTTPVTGVLTGNSLAAPDNNSIFGLSGTKLRASYIFQDILLATFGLQVPTGTNELTLPQSRLEGAFSTEQMNLRVSGTGTGWNTHTTVSTAFEVADDLMLGASLGILTYGPYHPTESYPGFNNQTGLPEDITDDWNSGNEFSVAVGVDYITYQMNRKIKILSDLIYTYYTKDEWNGSDIFKAGPKWSLNTSAGVKLSSEFYYTGNLSLTFKQRNSFSFTDFSAVPAQQAEVHRKAGFNILLSNYFQLLEDKTYNPFLMARIRKYGAKHSYDGLRTFGNALIVGVGGGGKYRLQENMFVNGQTVLDMGGMDGNFIHGFEVSGGVQFSF